MSFLKIANVSKSFASTQVLNDINIDIAEGEFVVLVGPSGCGKSTLLNTIAGLENVTAGQIEIAGQDVTHTVPADRDIAMVFQSYALYPNMTVEKNITFALEMRGMSAEAQRKACAEVSEVLQISHLLKRKPGQLSGGQRQRVAMGRALVRNPQVFLFDEPLSNLDAKLRVDMRTEIKQLHAKLGTTIVYVTHDQIEAMTLANRIAVMNGGIIQQLGTPDDIYNRPANLFVASFMGSPSMNILDVTLAQKKTGIEVTLPNGDKFTLADSNIDLKSLKDRQVKMGIRPESIMEKAPASSKDFATLNQLIDVVEPSGSDTFVIFQLSETTMNARFAGDSTVKSGEKIKFHLDLRRVHFFDPETGDRL